MPRIPVTFALIAANVAVFAAMLWHGASLWHFSSGVQLAWGANFGPATKDGEWWRLGSALFLHFGIFHLGMNMLSLWDCGRLVERMYGHGRFLLIYLAAGLMGNLLSLIAQGDKAVSGGASGAIFGVYGALMAYLWLERSRVHAKDFKRLFWGAALFSALSIGLGLQITGIDNAAHIGGLLGGGLCGLALARADASGERPRRLVKPLSAIAYLLCIVLMLTNMPAPRYRWSEEQRARAEILHFLGEDAQIGMQWSEILDRAQGGGTSFAQLAGEVETQVTSQYEASFEQLSRIHLDAAAPSAPTLAILRQYAEKRRDASRALAEGLLAQDPERVNQSLEMARQAVEQTQVVPGRPASAHAAGK